VLLGAFAGEAIAGTWRLTVADTAGGDTGVFDEWCLLPTLQGFGVEHCKWRGRANSPTVQLRALGVFFPDDGHFYALGGRNNDTFGSDLVHPREYRPESDTWLTRASSFPDVEIDNMVGGVLELGGKRYIIAVGGSAAGQLTATAAVRLYDPSLDAFTTVSTDPWPGAGTTVLPGGAAVWSNKLFVFGGYDINNHMVNDIWEFDPSLAAGFRWQQKNSLVPAAMGYIATAESGGFIYLLGGSIFVNNAVTDWNAAYRYDPRTDTIVTLPVVPRAVGETQAVTASDGTIWVLGGGRNAPNPNTEVDIYHPGTNTWTVGPSLPTARRNFAAAIDPTTNRIWAAGGYAADNVTPLAILEELACLLLRDDFETGRLDLWSLTEP
jgi:hypothetical protein